MCTDVHFPCVAGWNSTEHSGDGAPAEQSAETAAMAVAVAVAISVAVARALDSTEMTLGSLQMYAVASAAAAQHRRSCARGNSCLRQCLRQHGRVLECYCTGSNDQPSSYTKLCMVLSSRSLTCMHTSA